MPTLEQKQTAMRLKSGKRPDHVAEAKVRVSLYLLLVAGDEDLDQLARRFGRSRTWLKGWVDDGCPLMSAP